VLSKVDEDPNLLRLLFEENDVFCSSGTRNNADVKFVISSHAAV